MGASWWRIVTYLMELNMSSLNTAVKKVFEERSKFVIIGLTGRTGAGCTTTGELLEKSFQDFSPPLVNSSENMNEEDRQYQVSLNYLKVKWPKFFLLRAADVISSFILEGSFTEFKNKFCMLNENISSAKFEQDYEITLPDSLKEFITNNNGEIIITLNEGNIPPLRINKTYQSLIYTK